MFILLNFPGKGKRPIGPITGFIVAERDGTVREEPLVQNKEIGEVTRYALTTKRCLYTFDTLFVLNKNHHRRSTSWFLF